MYLLQEQLVLMTFTGLLQLYLLQELIYLLVAVDAAETAALIPTQAVAQAD